MFLLTSTMCDCRSLQLQNISVHLDAVVQKAFHFTPPKCSAAALLLFHRRDGSGLYRRGGVWQNRVLGNCLPLHCILLPTSGDNPEKVNLKRGDLCRWFFFERRSCIRHVNRTCPLYSPHVSPLTLLQKKR